MGKNMGKELDKGFGITKEDKDNRIAVDHVIDTNKRGTDGYNGGEPRMSDKK